MKTLSKKMPIPAGVELRGQWHYRLPDPFRQVPYLPLDAATLSESLGMSYRAALRVCKGEKSLPAAQVRFLQVVHFGLIPDPDFLRGGWRLVRGRIVSSKWPGPGFGSGELAELSLLLPEYRRMLDDMERARARLAAADDLADRYERLRLRYRETVRELREARRELARRDGPDLSNVIRFPRR